VVHYDKLARFLEAQGLKEEALQIVQDTDHKFELAMSLGRLDLAHAIAATSDQEHKWESLGDAALAKNNFDLAEECMTACKDLSGLLLLHSAQGNRGGMESLAGLCESQSRFNVGFMSLFLSGKLEDCLQLLVDCDRISEASFFARTYLPSQMGRVVELWRADVAKVNEKAAEGIANPDDYPNLFPNLESALIAEAALKQHRAQSVPASQYEAMRELLLKDPLSEEGLASLAGGMPISAPAAAPSMDPLEKAFEDAQAEEQEEEEEDLSHQADSIVASIIAPAVSVPPTVSAPPVVRPPPAVSAPPVVSAPPAVTAPPTVTAPPRVTAPPALPPRVTAPPTMTTPAVVTAPPPMVPPSVSAPPASTEEDDFGMEDDWGMED